MLRPGEVQTALDFDACAGRRIAPRAYGIQNRNFLLNMRIGGVNPNSQVLAPLSLAWQPKDDSCRF